MHRRDGHPALSNIQTSCRYAYKQTDPTPYKRDIQDSCFCGLSAWTWGFFVVVVAFCCCFRTQVLMIFLHLCGDFFFFFFYFFFTEGLMIL